MKRIWAGPLGTSSCFGPNHWSAGLGRTESAAKAPSRKPTTPAKLELAAMPAGHQAKKPARALDQKWGDANNTTSAIRVATGMIQGGRPTAKQLGDIAEKLLAAELARAEGKGVKPEAITVRTSPKAVTGIADAARTVSTDGFVYSPSNRSDRQETYDDLKQVVGKLGFADILVAVQAKSRAFIASADEEMPVSLALFANPSTGAYVSVFVRGGTM